MSTYRRQSKSKDYRKIYEQYYGSIPKDETGRSYEIHHIDGNHNNNNPENLKAVTAEEHYKIHYERGDFGACRLIAIQRLNKSPEEIKEISRLLQLERVKNGTHHWQKRIDGTSFTSDRVNDPLYINAFARRPDGTSLTSDRTLLGLNPFARRPDGTSVASDLVKNGTHNLLKRSDGSSVSQETNAERVKNGTHNWLGSSMNEKMLLEGKHPSQQKNYRCEHCEKNFCKSHFTRWHGDNCKSLR